MINNTGIFDLICLTLLHKATYIKILYYKVPHKCGIFKLKKKKSNMTMALKIYHSWLSRPVVMYVPSYHAWQDLGFNLKHGW